MQVFADLKSGEHPSKFASQQTYHQPFLISTQAQKTQSNLFFTSQSLIVNSTEKVIGCFWAVGTVQKNLLVTKMYFECHWILHESITIEKNIFIPFSDGPAFFCVHPGPMKV